jgi:NAD(P)-dependent dehydrogenase (short-subunit alcohol dehydrogenase family)
MKILIVGGTGTIGAATAEAFEARGHEVIRVGHRDGDHTVDLGDPASIEALYDRVGPVDAVVCTAGIAVFGGLDDLDDAAFETSIANKMMGQVNLVRHGPAHVAEGGSFTLTTGTLSQRPSAGTVAVAMVGAGVEGFVKAAALDLEGRYRVNAVSPSHVAESRIASGLDPMPGIWAKDLAEYYVRCVEGDASGVVFEAEGPFPDVKA